MSTDGGDSITGKFYCKKCGQQITWPDDLPDSGVVSCPACGVEVGTLGEIKRLFLAQAKAKAVDLAKDIFKRNR
jgi:DNA-directed RNA polymerase subunit RPC12/RpoP